MKVRFLFFRRILSWVTCLLFISVHVSSQGPPSSTDLKQIVPPSPNASALGQYGNVPVGLYTGTAKIDVPLYLINEGALKLPISLAYNSGGIKVAEFATWTGLGWSLNAGGAITRTVFGLPDENRRTSPNYTVPTNPTNAQVKEALLGENYDNQPDIFNFNFNGRCGKFILTNTSLISIAPQQNLKIQAYDINGNPLNPPFYGMPVLMFRITDENGIVYEFKDYETTQTVSYNPLNGQVPDFKQPGVPSPSLTAWYLTDLFSPTGDTIRFSYGNYTLIYDLPSSEQNFNFLSGQTIDPDDPPTQARLVENVVRCQTQNKRLRQISFSNGSVVFSASEPRLDLVGDTVLDQMTILNSAGVTIKGYSFQYVGTGSPALTDDNYYGSYVAGTSQVSSNRVMLTGISELDNSLIPDGRNYSFSYSNGGLPSRFSKARDYWGYFNGSSDNESNFLNYNLVGADNTNPANYQIVGKEPDSNYCGGKILTKITYPTGGYTQLNYELNNAYVGRGVLPPAVTTQTFSMPIDFPSYGTNGFEAGQGYVDTLINGVNCYYKTFLVNTVGTGAFLNIQIANMMYQGSGKPIMKFDIYDSANQPFLLMWDLEGNNATITTTNTINSTTIADTYTLNDYSFPNGVYKVIFTPNTSFVGNTTYLNTYLAQPLFTASGWSNVTINSDTVDISRNVGGMRIRSTIDFDPVTNKYLQKNYSYTLIDSPALSSGELVCSISYIYKLIEVDLTTVTFTRDDGTTESQDHVAFYNYMVINGESNYPLSTTQGGNVGYSTVTVTETDPVTGIPNGKSEYHYTSPKTYPDYYGTLVGPSNSFPFPPADNRDWQRGLLTEKIDYQYSNGQYLPLRIENNNFGGPVYLSTIPGFTARYVDEAFPTISDTTATIEGVNGPIANPEVFTGTSFGLTAGYQLLNSKSVTEIENGNSLVTTENYTYGDVPGNMLPTSITTTDSKGNTVTTYLTYPPDYNVSSPGTSQAAGIANLQQSHIIAPVVEKFVQKTSPQGANIGVVSGIYTTYKPTLPMLDTLFSLQTSGPLTAYSPITISGSATAMDPHYAARLSFGQYDGKGNILQQGKVGDLYHSYLWDYSNRYLIAEVKNALPADIAYSSFESDGTGNWTIGSATVDSTTSITGSRSLNLAGSISRSGLNGATTYIVSYWTTNSGPLSIAGTASGYPLQGKTEFIHNNNWTLYVHKVTGQTSITLSGSGRIDELRLYPSTAQMTTYTFAPLIGMTSQTDVGNRVTYYEYDGLARLKRIRDHEYNILKTFDYQYQAPAGCGSGCSLLAMQTFLGTNTPGYPVGVFDVHGNLVGNATGASRYVSLWNSDTADSRIGTLTTGADSMHFNLLVNAGQTAPPYVMGLRYYQYDLAWNRIDGIENYNGAYVDFGDATHMQLPRTNTVGDTVYQMPPNTIRVGFSSQWDGTYWFIHTYPDTSLKTITIYHNDVAITTGLDNGTDPATSLTRVQNLRGNFPQTLQQIGGSCYQQANALTVANVTNWNTISTVRGFWAHCGDRVTPSLNMNYAQDFMANNRNLQVINTTQLSLYQSGYWDSTFKLTRLKSDWNTYFTNLQDIEICDAHWNREDLSALTHLSTFDLLPDNQNHSNNSTNNPNIAIPASAIDAILNQIAAGAGQSVSNGVIWILTGGSGRTSTSNTAVSTLDAKGWLIYIDNVQQ